MKRESIVIPFWDLLNQLNLLFGHIIVLFAVFKITSCCNTLTHAREWISKLACTVIKYKNILYVVVVQIRLYLSRSKRREYDHEE